MSQQISTVRIGYTPPCKDQARPAVPSRCQAQQLEFTILPSLWNVTPHFWHQNPNYQTDRLSPGRTVVRVSLKSRVCENLSLICTKLQQFLPSSRVTSLYYPSRQRSPRSLEAKCWKFSLPGLLPWQRLAATRLVGCTMHLAVFVKGRDRPKRRNSYVNTAKMGKTNISV